jgi:hypothetical protein
MHLTDLPQWLQEFAVRWAVLLEAWVAISVACAAAFAFVRMEERTECARIDAMDAELDLLLATGCAPTQQRKVRRVA